MITFIFAVRFTKELTRFKGFLSLGLVHVRMAYEIQSSTLKIEAETSRRALQKKEYILDSTKRKSLSTSNQRKVAGWKELTNDQKATDKPRDSTKQRVSQEYTPPLETNFSHDFFGTQLIIGDLRIGRNLSRKLHRMEIIKNQLFIDNVLQEFNPGELEKIKGLIRSSRK